MYAHIRPAFEEPSDPALLDHEPLVIHQRTENTRNNSLIIFVHGLGGRRYKRRYGRRPTWGQFPKFVYEDFPELDVGLYEYRTAFRRLIFWKSVRLDNEARVFAHIIRDIKNYRSIILVGHSMGGLLCMAAICYLIKSNEQNVLSRIGGLFLIAAPQLGSQWVSRLVSWFSNDFYALRRHGAFVTSIHETFSNYLVLDDSITNSNKTFIPTWAVLAVSDLFVDALSGGIGLPDARKKCVRGSHTAIVKPHDKKDEAYQFVSDRIKTSLGVIEASSVHPSLRQQVQDNGLISNPLGLIAHFVHCPERARDFQVRDEFQNLCKWWRNRGVGVCALVGIGGAGKSALVEYFLRIVPEIMPTDPDIPKDLSLRRPKGLFVFSFFKAPNPETFFAELWAWLTNQSYDPSISPNPSCSYTQIKHLLERANYPLLILDGLEKVQNSGTRSGVVGQIEDGRLRDLVSRVALGYLPVSIIITTRFVLDDLQVDNSPHYYPILVDRLPDVACIHLLRKRGVRGNPIQLRRIARDCGRHALTVDLVGGYIAYFGGGDPTTPLNLPSPQDMKRAAQQSPDRDLRYVEQQNIRFRSVAQNYRDALAKSDPGALALLQRVCLFRLGATADTLASIFTGEDKTKISGPDLAPLSKKELLSKLALLVELRLLEAMQLSQDSTHLYTVHPAVRDGFQPNSDDARPGHDAVRTALVAELDQRPGENPSDPATLDLLEEIVFHTLKAGHAEEAWHIYQERLGGYQNLDWRLGAYERGDRICRSFSNGYPPESAFPLKGLSPNNQARFFATWGVYLQDLGHLRPAARCYERAVNQEDPGIASLGNRNLANVLLLTGQLVAAHQAAEGSGH